MKTIVDSNLTKNNFMTNQSKNPIFWGLAAVVLGAALLIWGAVKGDCGGGPDCYVGSGFLKWTGGILIVGGLGLWFILGSGRRNR